MPTTAFAIIIATLKIIDNCLLDLWLPILMVLKYLCFAAQSREFDEENTQPPRKKEMPTEDGIEQSGGKSTRNVHNCLFMHIFFSICCFFTSKLLF